MFSISYHSRSGQAIKEDIAVESRGIRMVLVGPVSHRDPGSGIDKKRSHTDSVAPAAVSFDQVVIVAGRQISQPAFTDADDPHRRIRLNRRIKSDWETARRFAANRRRS